MYHHSPFGRSTEREAASRAAGAVTAITLSVSFALLTLGVPFFWVAYPVGFGAVLPVAVARARKRARGASRDRDRHHRPGRESNGSGDDEALAVLRERYARGEIDEAEFERRVESLLATESATDGGGEW